MRLLLLLVPALAFSACAGTAFDKDIRAKASSDTFTVNVSAVPPGISFSNKIELRDPSKK